MAVAAFQPAAVVYREEQNFDWRVYALVALAEGLVGLTLAWFTQRGHAPVAGGPLHELVWGLLALAGLGLPPLVVVGFLRMTTEVTPTDLRVWSPSARNNSFSLASDGAFAGDVLRPIQSGTAIDTTMASIRIAMLTQRIASDKGVPLLEMGK